MVKLSKVDEQIKALKENISSRFQSLHEEMDERFKKNSMKMEECMKKIETKFDSVIEAFKKEVLESLKVVGQRERHSGEDRQAPLLPTPPTPPIVARGIEGNFTRNRFQPFPIGNETSQGNESKGLMTNHGEGLLTKGISMERVNEKNLEHLQDMAPVEQQSERSDNRDVQGEIRFLNNCVHKVGKLGLPVTILEENVDFVDFGFSSLDVNNTEWYEFLGGLNLQFNDKKDDLMVKGNTEFNQLQLMDVVKKYVRKFEKLKDNVWLTAPVGLILITSCYTSSWNVVEWNSSSGVDVVKIVNPGNGNSVDIKSAHNGNCVRFVEDGILVRITILVFDPGKLVKRFVKLGMDLSMTNLIFFAVLQIFGDLHSYVVRSASLLSEFTRFNAMYFRSSYDSRVRHLKEQLNVILMQVVELGNCGILKVDILLQIVVTAVMSTAISISSFPKNEETPVNWQHLLAATTCLKLVVVIPTLVGGIPIKSCWCTKCDITRCYKLGKSVHVFCVHLVTMIVIASYWFRCLDIVGWYITWYGEVAEGNLEFIAVDEQAMLFKQVKGAALSKNFVHDYKAERERSLGGQRKMAVAVWKLFGTDSSLALVARSQQQLFAANLELGTVTVTILASLQSGNVSMMLLIQWRRLESFRYKPQQQFWTLCPRWWFRVTDLAVNHKLSHGLSVVQARVTDFKVP